MGRWKDAVVTGASAAPIRPIIPLAALAICSPKPCLSWSGWSSGLGYNVLDTIDITDVSANNGLFIVNVYIDVHPHWATEPSVVGQSS